MRRMLSERLQFPVLALVTAVLMTGCGPVTLPFGGGIQTSQPPAIRAETPGLVATTTAIATSTLEPFALELTPLPTETALPTLELPTQAVLSGFTQVWDGLPTYLADSKPGFYFRLQFDPTSWALTTDQFGAPALAHRSISGCVISPAAGRGLPMSGTVNHETRMIGAVDFQISTALVNGVKQFVNYTGGDGNVYTAFEVSFKDQPDACLSEAEKVLGTLESMPTFEATAPATP